MLSSPLSSNTARDRSASTMSGEPQTHVAHKSSKGKGFVATRAKQAAAFREGGAGAQRSGNTQKRAFGVANLGRAKRSVQRNADRGHRKEVVPLVQRARTEGAPPVVVVVCGPRGSGKSTLIRSLVKLYTRHNLASVDGPVTITVGNRAAKESEIPNFKGSDLGRFPLVSADFWTSDHLSERSRRVGAFSGTRARGTLKLKRR